MTKTLIRHATDEDFPVLLHIDRASFPPDVAYDSMELAYFMDRPGAETIVLEHEGLIVAFLIMDIHRGRRAATLVTLDVRTEYRRLGYGSRLLGQSEEILAGYGMKAYELQVDVHNAGAIAFYRRHGFEAAGILPSYYGNGHDAHQMVKALPTSGGT